MDFAHYLTPEAKLWLLKPEVLGKIGRAHV